MAQSLASLAESMPMDQFVSVDRWLSDCIAGSRQSERMIQIPYTDCSTSSVNYRGTNLLVRQPYKGRYTNISPPKWLISVQSVQGKGL